MTDRQIELAWCFADLYFNRVPKQIPWSYPRFWQSITRDSPMEWVLGEEGRARYEPVFAVFGGDIEMPDGIIGALD